MSPPVHVAVGVILDSQRNVLVSLRHAGGHQGGLWEFPGGKLEKNETVVSALEREL
ncbi:MAG TPA: NUDIX domain-containing protein, partial [Gammaproteobacteria bacterium]|nr:NUDIX domain-containing protein [Gammaproteobacteria bacterium]